MILTESLLLIQSNPNIYYGLIALLGLCVGSFLNVVGYRLPIMLNKSWREQCHEFLALPKVMAYRKPKYITHGNVDIANDKFSLSFPSSHCPQCKHKLHWWNNIPVMSYLLLKGQCHFCHKKIPFRYPLVELLTACASLMVAITFGSTLAGLYALIFTWIAIAMTLIDLDHQLLPDSLTLCLLWLGLVINISSTFVPLSDAVIGALAGYLSLWGFVKLFYLITGKIGMGEGDFKLFAAFGAWFGWQMLPMILVGSSLVGAIIGSIHLRRQGFDNSTPIPFGPYLCITAWFVLLWGDDLLRAYLSLYR